MKKHVFNRILNLDLVVRDDQGNVLNPLDICAIDLYKIHDQSTKRIKQSIANLKPEDSNKKKLNMSFNYFSHNLCVIVKNFACHIGEDVNLLMSLYDGKEMRFISENFFVKWNPNFLMDLDLLNNLKVLFCVRNLVFFVKLES